MNTVVEEPKTKASEPVSHDIKGRQQSTGAVATSRSLKPENANGLTEENRQQSCLELAALFLGRG